MSEVRTEHCHDESCCWHTYGKHSACRLKQWQLNGTHSAQRVLVRVHLYWVTSCAKKPSALPQKSLPFGILPTWVHWRLVATGGVESDSSLLLSPLNVDTFLISSILSSPKWHCKVQRWTQHLLTHTNDLTHQKDVVDSISKSHILIKLNTSIFVSRAVCELCQGAFVITNDAIMNL